MVVLRKVDQTMITDITLDHLPDLSEESLSFEIPNDNSSADNLLSDATGFNTLYNAMDDETSFAPMAHLAAQTHRHGRMEALTDLTPRAGPTKRLQPRSPSPSATPGPSLSISQPSEMPPPPTLRRSPRKRRETPSRAPSQPRRPSVEDSLVSEEPPDQLRADEQTLGQVHEALTSHTSLNEDLPVRDRRTPSRSRSQRRSQLVSEEHLNHLPEVNTLDQELVIRPHEAMDDIVRDTDVPIKKRGTSSRASSRRSARFVSEERRDLIPELQTSTEDPHPKSREDDAYAVASTDTLVAIHRRRSSCSPSKWRSQLLSEEPLEQIPEAETLGRELDTQPCQDVDIVTQDMSVSRRRSKLPSRARSKQSMRLVSEERLFPIPEVQTLDRQLELHVHELSEDAAPHDKDISVINTETSSRVASIQPENPPVSEGTPPDQAIAVQTFDQPLETETDRDVVMMATHDTDEVETMTPPKSRVKRNTRTKAKPTVLAGGISKAPALPNSRVSKKTKAKPSSVREAPPVPSSATGRASPPQSVVAIDAAENLVPPASIDGDIDMISENTQFTHPSTSGMAKRLVSYSQKLISSIGLYQPWSEPTFTEDANDAVRAASQGGTQSPATIPSPAYSLSTTAPTARDEPSAREDSLRPTEISPRGSPSDGKPRSALPVGAPQDGWHRARAMSPLRPAKKRHSTDADPATREQEQPRRKKGKTMLASDINSKRGSSEEASSQAQSCPDNEDQQVMNFVQHGQDKARHDAVPKSALPSARTKYKPKLEATPERKGPTLRALPYMASSHQVSTVRPGPTMGSSSASLRSRVKARHGGTAASGKSLDVCRTRERSGPISTVNTALAEKKPNATGPVAQLTKPVAFTFRVDARLETRKIEEKLAANEPGKACQDHAVPDFKALHESHQASLGFRKENVVPSVPVVPFFFRTEQRVKEREKFDEMVRRKEEEMEQLKVEQRRVEAEEEERAIRELRRKAIPKANELPEWYADMPKRKGTAV